MKFQSLGMLCLAAFLILTGVLTVTNITIAAAALVQGGLALAAGVLLLIGK